MDLNINSAWSATSAVLKNSFSFYDIKEIVGLAGFDNSQIAHLVQCSGSSVSKGQLITSIDQGLSRSLSEGSRGRPLDYWFTNNFIYDIQIICHVKPA